MLTTFCLFEILFWQLQISHKSLLRGAELYIIASEITRYDIRCQSKNQLSKLPAYQKGWTRTFMKDRRAPKLEEIGVLKFPRKP